MLKKLSLDASPNSKFLRVENPTYREKLQLRESMARLRELRKGFKAIQDSELVNLFKSEINLELSSNHFQVLPTPTLNPFLQSIQLFDFQIFSSLEIKKILLF